MIRLGCFPILACSAWTQSITFDSVKTGSVPPDWTVAMTHEGGAPKWEIVSEVSAPSKPMDLPPFLTQTVKTQNPSNGELSHGVVA